MQKLSPRGFLDIGPQRLEYSFSGPAPEKAPTLILLHEGLGCVELWGDFPQKLQAATGVGVFAYSRAGYGASSPVALPRKLTYMHEEGQRVLPLVLEAIGMRRAILVGHSDGASIAAIYAGSIQDHRIRGLSLIAPHFICETLGLAAIKAARQAYETGDLKERLARRHADPDNAFLGWSDAWLDPGFHHWDISEMLAYIRVPVQIIQGGDDQYGTMRQIEIAQEECYCPVDVTLMPGIGHAPQKEAPAETLAAMAEFVNRLLLTHGEGKIAA